MTETTDTSPPVARDRTEQEEKNFNTLLRRAKADRLWTMPVVDSSGQVRICICSAEWQPLAILVGDEPYQAFGTGGSLHPAVGKKRRKA
jgi:hypothetical protein